MGRLGGEQLHKVVLSGHVDEPVWRTDKGRRDGQGRDGGRMKGGEMDRGGMEEG